MKGKSSGAWAWKKSQMMREGEEEKDFRGGFRAAKIRAPRLDVDQVSPAFFSIKCTPLCS